jgi:hypothetical protein
MEEDRKPGAKEDTSEASGPAAKTRWTYTRERDATVAALGRGRRLFDVVVYELATRRLHDPSAVRRRVVRVALAESDALSHGATQKDC